MRDVVIHMVSDATGQTLQGLAEACLAQFDGIHPMRRLWPLVRSERQLERVIREIEDAPGPVMYTLMEDRLIEPLRAACGRLGVPCIAVMTPLVQALSSYLGLKSKNVPGLQHKLDDSYFRRMDAIDFAMGFDDGQNVSGLDTADVILTGVSRTSKTPTCIYLARQGIRAANIPLVPGIVLPDSVLALRGPLFVGLTVSPDRLLQVRSARLKIDQKDLPSHSAYIDPEQIEEEVESALRLFRSQRWPVIDVTRRSVEETAAEVMVLLQRKGGRA